MFLSLVHSDTIVDAIAISEGDVMSAIDGLENNVNFGPGVISPYSVNKYFPSRYFYLIHFQHIYRQF